jgi:hypothetical protein
MVFRQAVLQIELVVYVPLSRLCETRLLCGRAIICPAHIFHETGFLPCLAHSPHVPPYFFIHPVDIEEIIRLRACQAKIP